jgi:heat shock protein HslJ
MSGGDGMCRPVGHQAFVYQDGRYAGTLSPVAMYSRTDGSLTNIKVTTSTTILAEFTRYTDSDALCCPSRITHVTYVVRRDELPLVVPFNIKTVAFSPNDDTTSSPSTGGAQLTSKKWMLAEVEGVEVTAGKAFIQFDGPEKRVSGDGGCNRFSGTFQLDGAKLKLSPLISTKRACVDAELQEIEDVLLALLEKVKRYEIDNDTLYLYEDDFAALAFKVEPESVSATVPGAGKLFGPMWMLTEIHGRAVATSKPYIQLDGASRRVSGDGGCNRFSGVFEIDGANLRLSRLSSTKRACVDNQLQQIETSFMSALDRVTRFEVRGDTLRLYAGGSPVLAFKK